MALRISFHFALCFRIARHGGFLMDLAYLCLLSFLFFFLIFLFLLLMPLGLRDLTGRIFIPLLLVVSGMA
jgi:hypothetical protein